MLQTLNCLSPRRSSFQLLSILVVYTNLWSVSVWMSFWWRTVSWRGAVLVDSNHLSKARVVTLVTSHSSGSLCPNQMELQNGCVSLAHASTLFHRHLLDHVQSREWCGWQWEAEGKLGPRCRCIYFQSWCSPLWHPTIHLYKVANDNVQVRRFC